MFVFFSLQGASDFIGLNYYTSELVTMKSTPSYKVDYKEDGDINAIKDPSWLG
jgi:beta-glucosidase/6-phospho-beta-glucosidase/beta-galactosidase